jgi:hypothetical protein
MNKKQRGILVGMLLGDGCIKVKYHTKKDSTVSVYNEFVMAHGPNQLRYLQYKASKVHSIIGGKPLKVSEGSHFLKSNQTTHKTYRVSRCHKYFKLLHRWAYSNNGKKYYTRKLLDKLTNEGISYWYMDDGCFVPTKNNANEISSFAIRLYTYCSKKEAETIREYFNDVWGISFKVSHYKRNDSYTLRTNTEEGEKFLSIVRPFVAPGLEYKFLECAKTRVRNIPSSRTKDNEIV